MTQVKRKKRKISKARRARNLFWGTILLTASIPLTLLTNNLSVLFIFGSIGFICIKDNALN